METVNCLVVDDEPLARNIIETYVARIPGWIVKHSCINAMEAYDAILESKIDVLFLDINMPGITGIEFLRSLKSPPCVIFTTAYAEHAVTGFELSAIDYLVKPITFDRFYQAAMKINERMLLNAASKPAMQHLSDYFFIRQDNRLVRINYKDVKYLEAYRDFTYIHLTTGKKLLASMHLKAMEEILTPVQIVRVHRSYIVNIDSIRSIKGNLIEIDETEIPIGANYKEALSKLLNL